MTIKQLQKDIHEYAIGHGWWDGERSMGDVIANIHSEVSEAWEDYRNGKDLLEIWYVGALADGAARKPCGFPTEMADTVIRVLDLCEHLGIDLEAVIEEKMAYNRTRPFRHGGKLA